MKRFLKFKYIKKLIIFGLCCALTGGLTLLSVNAVIKNSVDERIIFSTEATKLNDIDCILVLGCRVFDDGTPSDMLGDRLERAVELYKLGVSSKILMSGDHGRAEYNEVAVMKQFAIDSGVPSSDVFMDHAGFSTYESMYRAKEIFGADKIVIVTQEYHLYRALYVANELGIDAYGVSSDQHTYRGQASRNAREILARAKDFSMSIFKPKPTYLGDFICINGDGNVTND